eukprot:7384793-Prymnesium_polylepis.1
MEHLGAVCRACCVSTVMMSCRVARRSRENVERCHIRELRVRVILWYESIGVVFFHPWDSSERVGAL